MAARSKVLTDEELVEIMNKSGALSVDNSSDSECVDDVSEESDVEDNLEPDILYDSDEDREYVPQIESESDSEGEEDLQRRKIRRRMFTSTPRKGRASATTSAAIPAASSGLQLTEARGQLPSN